MLQARDSYDLEPILSHRLPDRSFLSYPIYSPTTTTGRRGTTGTRVRFASHSDNQPYRL